MHDAAKRGRRLAARLDLPDPWRVEDLCEQIAVDRHRPITIIDRPACGDSITAMVMCTSEADYIFCRDDIRGSHRDHAVCHELGHLIAGHTAEPDQTISTQLAEVLVLHRDCEYGPRREQEAEAIADAIMERVSHRVAGDRHNRQTRRVINGLSDAFR